MPAEVLIVTCGVDVQDDRLEATVTGWTAELKRSCWRIM
jgi:phage terminase large subunit GpA-like protein